MAGEGANIKIQLGETLIGYVPPNSPVLSAETAAGVKTIIIDSDGSIPLSTNIVESSAAAAFAVGPNGNTNPVFRVVGNVGSQATGVSVTGRAAGSGADLTVISSGTNENLVINAKGSGTISLNPTGTGAILVNQNLTIADGKDIVLDTTTGTKIGTATGQKLGFYNATPIAKPTLATDDAAGIITALVNLGLVTAAG